MSSFAGLKAAGCARSPATQPTVPVTRASMPQTPATRRKRSEDTRRTIRPPRVRFGSGGGSGWVAAAVAVAAGLLRGQAEEDRGQADDHQRRPRVGALVREAEQPRGERE